eukprot:3646616-Amphidinium_carterae.1
MLVLLALIICTFRGEGLEGLQSHLDVVSGQSIERESMRIPSKPGDLGGQLQNGSVQEEGVSCPR